MRFSNKIEMSYLSLSVSKQRKKMVFNEVCLHSATNFNVNVSLTLKNSKKKVCLGGNSHKMKNLKLELNP